MTDQRSGLNMERLTEEIRAGLRSWIPTFRIEVRDDGLILHGQAISFYGKQVALHETRRRTGLPVIANLISVRAGQRYNKEVSIRDEVDPAPPRIDPCH